MSSRIRFERSSFEVIALLAYSVLLIVPTPAARADDAAPTFEKHIAPFLKTYCVGCHDGGDDSKGGLSLLTHKTLLAGGDGGEVIVAGKSGESRLVRMLVGTAKPKMPPKDSKQPKAEEIEFVKRWVDLGAQGPAVTTPQSADELTLPHIQPKATVAAAISSVRYSPDGRWLAAARHRNVLIIDAATGAIAQTLTGADNPINAVAFSANSRFVAAAEGLPSVVGKVRIWDLGEGRETSAAGTVSATERNLTISVRALTGHTDSIYALAFSPDGAQLVTASYDKLIIVWDVATGAEKQTLKHHTAAVFGLAWSPDGTTLASAAADQTVKLWNVATGERILTLTEPTKPLCAVAFHPQGNELAAVGSDKMIRLYDWNGSVAKLKRSAFAHDAPILAATYSPDGLTLFTAAEDRRIKAWDVTTLQERHVYERLADWPLALAVHPRGDQLAAGLFGGELKIFDTRSPEKLRDLRLESGERSQRAEVRGTGDAPDSIDGNSIPPKSEIRNPKSQASEIENPKSKIENPKPNPPTPRFDSVSPRAVVRGNKIKFTLSGQNVAAADRVFVSNDNLKAMLLPADPMKPGQAFCEIEIPADMDPGTVSLRLHTPLGTAGAKSFYVGPFAETNEKEDNNSRDKATPFTLPQTLVGAINTRGDRDFWAFDAQPGQELVFLLVGPNVGSALQARLALLDESGRTLQTVVRRPARSEVVIGHKFTMGGRFFFQIEDRDNTGGGNHYYYLHAGEFPFVDGAWPLAIRASDRGEPVAGEVTSVELAGFNLPPGSKFQSTPGAGTRFIHPFAAAGKALNPARYESSAFPEFVERETNDTPQNAQALPIPSAVSGRIARKDSGFGIRDSGGRSQGTGNRSQESAGIAQPDRKSEIENPRSPSDHFSFNALRGERLTIETFARRLGSPVDTVLDILDADGRPVPRATLRAVAETYIVLRDHDSKVKGIRLQAWDDILPNDYVMIGAEVIKVQILPLGPDEDVKFFDRSGSRLPQFGTTSQAHAINTQAYKVEIHPPGMTFPPNGMPVVPLDWRNDDSPGLGGDSQVFFDVPADGKYIVRVRDVRDLAGDDFVYRLVVRPRQEDFRISLDPENPNIPRGGSLPITVNVDRRNGFEGPVDVRIEGLPEGITATTTRIGPELFSGVLTLTAGESAAGEPVASASGPSQGTSALAMRAIASAMIAGKHVEHATTPAFGSHHVTITSPPDIRVSVEPTFAEIAPGQELRFTATIERRNAFKGRVPIEVLNLPHGLRVLDVGLNGVLINENEISRSFVVACDPWAESGSVTFYAAAKVEAKNERHAATPLRLEVKGTRPPLAAVK